MGSVNHCYRRCYRICHGITKDPSGNDYLLVFRYYVLNDNLTKTFGKVTWKYKIDELISKLSNTLNELINRNDLSVKTAELSNELLVTSEIIEKCSNCISKKTDRNDFDEIHELTNEIENCLTGLQQEEQEEGDITAKLNYELFKADKRLNKKILCEDFKG